MILSELRSLKNDSQSLKNDMDSLKDDVQTLKDNVQPLNIRVDNLEQKTTATNLHPENITDKNIRLIAENFIELTKKLNQAIPFADRNLAYGVKVNYLVEEVH